MKILVIGLGSIGKRHIMNLIAAGVSAEDIAGVDPREDRRVEVQQRFGIKKVFSKLEESSSIHFDGAVICSPTSMHIQQALFLAARKTHIMIEKPLAANLDGIEQLQDMVAKNGVKILIAYIFRFSPSVSKLKELVDSKVIGRPLYFHGEFSEYLPDWHPWEDYRSFYMAKKSLGGGSILDQSHIIDLGHYLLGEVSEVYCINERFSDLEVEADDLAEIMVKFKSGVPGTIHSDMFGRYHRKRLEIKGAVGNLMWDFYDYSVELFHGEEKRTEKWSFRKDANEMYTIETKHFLDCLRGNKEPAIPLSEGIHSMKIILAAEESSRTHKMVVVD